MKKKIMSILCLILALTMVFGLVACGAEEPVEEPVVDEQPVEGEAEGGEERENVSLKIYSSCGWELPGRAVAMEAASKYIEEKLNTTVEFVVVGSAEFQETVPTIFSAGGQMDAVLVGGGMGGLDFASNVAKNGFVEITPEMIDTYLPGTKAQLPEASWDALSYQGKIYGIGMNKDLANYLGIYVNQDLMEELGVTFPEDYDTYFDLVEFFREFKAARDAKYPDKAAQPLLFTDAIFGYDWWMNAESLLGSYIVCANIPGMNGLQSIAADGSEVTSIFYTEEFREMAKVFKTMIEEEIFSDESQEGISGLINDGEAIGGPTWGHLTMDGVYSYNAVIYPKNQATLTSSGLTSVAWALPQQCSNVERTLEVIELLNTDQYLATTMRFGPEGQGWNDVDNDGVLEFEGTMNENQDWWYYWYGPALGSFTASKAPAGYPANFAEIIADMNAAGVPSANLGFGFDASEVQTELAAVNSVIEQYKGIFMFGKADDVDATVDEFVAKLKASGLDTIVAEAQAQLDAWRAANGL